MREGRGGEPIRDWQSRAGDCSIVRNAGESDACPRPSGCYKYEGKFSTVLCVVNAAASDITVSYNQLPIRSPLASSPPQRWLRDHF
jgi:hypothetical protein